MVVVVVVVEPFAARSKAKLCLYVDFGLEVSLFFHKTRENIILP